MPKMIEATLYHGLGLDAGAAHNFMMRGCSQSETRTLYHLHDYGGTRFTLVTDDLNFDPSVWGQQVKALEMRNYHPQPQQGRECGFTLRLNRERRGRTGGVFKTDEEIDFLLHRLMTRAGAEVLGYNMRLDAGYRLNADAPNIPTVTIHGALRVVESSHFHVALLQGLGRTKRYGCGLILLHPE